MLKWLRRFRTEGSPPAVFIPENTPAELRKEGNARLNRGDLSGAETSYRQILERDPSDATALVNLAFVLQEQQRFREAEPYALRATTLDRNSADAFFLLSRSQAGTGTWSRAIESLRRVLQLNPAFEQAYGDLCRLLIEQKQHDEAREVVGRALKLNDLSGEFHFHLGNIELAAGNRAAAATSFRRSLELFPGVPSVLSNLGMALDGREALECFREASRLDSSSLIARSNMLSSLSFDLTCSPGEYLAEAVAYGELAKRGAAPFGDWPAAVARTPAMPLRVGIVSGDLKSHPVGYFLEAVAASLAEHGIELVAYSTNSVEDALTARIRPRFAVWRSLAGVSDGAAAKIICADGVQLLIDMAGHTSNNRLPIFAWRAAPVQVSWLGYWASTGISAIDYVLADERCLPPDEESQYIEKVWRLPETRFCFTPPLGAPPVAPLPAQARGHLTFGSFQRLEKISDETIVLWSAVLHSQPAAQFRLQSRRLDRRPEQQRLLERFSAHGIASDRLSFQGGMPRSEYLSAHADVDIILDSYPYTGGATTCEALWMGVPTVTIQGTNMLTRQGSSLMRTIGLDDWIATDLDTYVGTALAGTADLAQLAAFRSTLRERMCNSPLCDAERFAAELADALHRMAATGKVRDTTCSPG